MKPGLTLLELLLVLTLLALLAGVAGLTTSTATHVSGTSPQMARVAAARDSAIRAGRAVTIRFSTSTSPREATAYPDGRVSADSALGVDPLTGRERDRWGAP